MGSLDILRQEVDRLYTTQNAQRSAFADWLYANHVYQVAETSADVAKRFGGDADMAYAAGALHDVADALMPRQDSAHAARSAEIAREVLGKAGFTEVQITVIVDDALRFHSCHGADRPQTLEGKALATGDAIAHLTTDFYPYVSQAGDFAKGKTTEQISEWLSEKINRDFNAKIAYDEIREEVRKSYETLMHRFAL